jgi:uncharacterized membrane protein
MNPATMTLPAGSDVLTEKARISSIDLMRGIVMVVMALDHSRDFFHQGALVSNPTDLATTTPVIFFTRWITHFCAPTFVMLAGTSIFLSSQKKSKNDLSVFLLTRGLWLILLEVVVVRFSILFNLYYDVIIFQVIFVIGAAMVCMAALSRLPYAAVLAVGILILFGHNVGDYFPLKDGDSFFIGWSILRQTGFLNLSPDHSLMVLYPVLPWLGIMILGYALGRLYTNEFSSERRTKLLFAIGGTAVLGFVLLRAINMYGDPAPWSTQKTGLYTFMSFLNTTKYPVSLQYTLMTLGPVLLTLGLLERVNLRFLNPLVVFGRVPLFYYVIHFYIIHTAALILFMNKTGKGLSDIDFHFSQSFGGITPDGGYSLFWAYVGWLAVVVALYPLCKWYNRYKSAHKQWWLSYL